MANENLDLEAPAIPSVFGGVDPFLSPTIPSDGAEAIGQLFNLAIFLNGRLLAAEKKIKGIEDKLGYADVQRQWKESQESYERLRNNREIPPSAV